MWRTSSKFTRFNISAVSLLTAVGMTMLAAPAQAAPPEPSCVVTGYSVGYDGSAHDATAVCVDPGDMVTPVTGSLTGTTHTDAGAWTDSWTFTPDDSVNFSPATGSVSDSITAISVAVSAVTDNKDYDGLNTSAGVPTYAPDPLGSDVFTCSQTFDSVNAAVSVGLTASCSVTTGTPGNYSFSYTGASGSIDPLTINVSAVTDTKHFDGTTTSDGVPTYAPSPIGTDAFSCSQTYDTEHTGTGKTLTALCTVSSGLSGNYAFVYTADTTGVIEQAHFGGLSSPVGTITYTGTIIAPKVSTLNLSAALSNPIPSYCPVDQFVYEFSSDNGDNWTYYTPTAGVSTQQVPMSYIQPNPLQPGVYLVRVHYLGDEDCEAAFSAPETLTVFDNANNAYGGGWYTMPDYGGKASFGFVVQPVPPKSGYWKGQLVWNWKNQWRFKGTLSVFSKGYIGSIPTGSASGVGTLQYWDPNYYGEGIGGWRVAATGVNVIIYFQPTMLPSTKQKTTGLPGAFAISFGYTAQAGEPTLPKASSWATLKFGSLKSGMIKFS